MTTPSLDQATLEAVARVRKVLAMDTWAVSVVGSPVSVYAADLRTILDALGDKKVKVK